MVSIPAITTTGGAGANMIAATAREIQRDRGEIFRFPLQRAAIRLAATLGSPSRKRRQGTPRAARASVICA
jgi:hypothetical protein